MRHLATWPRIPGLRRSTVFISNQAITTTATAMTTAIATVGRMPQKGPSEFTAPSAPSRTLSGTFSVSGIPVGSAVDSAAAPAAVRTESDSARGDRSEHVLQSDISR